MRSLVLMPLLVSLSLTAAAGQSFPSRPSRPADTPSVPGLPESRVVPAFATLPDPTRWSVDPHTGARFRRATRAELQRNQWDAGTYLIEGRALLGAATSGAERIDVLVPLSDTRTRRVELDLRDAVVGLEFIERRAQPRGLKTTIKRPTLFEYVTTGLDLRRARPMRGAWLGLLAGDDGGVYGYGLLEGVEIAIDAPNPGWYVAPLPAPGPAIKPSDLMKVSQLWLGSFGEAQFEQCSNDLVLTCGWLCAVIPGLPCDNNPHLDPSPATNHCTDGFDNDGDNKSDSGDEDCLHHPSNFGGDSVEHAEWGCDQHPGLEVHRWESGKSFALFGEGRFCTRYGAGPHRQIETGNQPTGNWIQRLTRVGWDSEAFLTSVSSNLLFDGEGQPRYVAGGCWVFDNLVAAQACAADASDCDVADAALYPYGGAGNSDNAHYNHVWDDVAHGMAHGLSHPLSLAQVVYWGGSDAAPTQIDCGATEGSGCCGSAPTGVPTWDYTDLAANQRGASVIQYDNCVAPKIVSAHELSHSLGLDHDNADGPCQGGIGSCTGYMAESGGSAAAVAPANQAQLDGCLLDWECPRPSGFKAPTPTP
jgi:hypothetical protein